MRPHLATLVEDFRRHGNDTAIVTYHGNRRTATTYVELADLASRFAAELMRRGISSGERVVLWGQNRGEWVGAFFGCLMRGVIAVPLDAGGALDFAKRVIVETSPRLVVGDGQLLRQLESESPRLSFDEFGTALPKNVSGQVEPRLSLDTPLQILFTSGTTAEPKGIVHTHRNVLASVAPIEREMQKYLKYERIFHPLRFLHTLPLSHVFGQFMGLWLPPLLGGEVHFESRLQAQRLIEIIRRERISVLAAVPRVLELLREALMGEHPSLTPEIKAVQGEKVWKRWWYFRNIHRTFGYKFWAFVCGGASLPPELESFWNTLGFALVQGYGMTETTALISLNHPFKVGKGTIGKVLPGREVEIRNDGEVVVRGDMISTATWRNGGMQKSESPWLATGDLAQRDEVGQLRFLGRKSQVIVTSSGLNIHPEDVEAVLNQQPGVEGSAVVALAADGGSEPVAVLLFRGSRDAAQAAVVAANRNLAEFQKVRQWQMWPELDFPRTSTGKIRRGKVTEWVNAQRDSADAAGPSADPLLALIVAITGARPANQSDDARLVEDLQLDSLGRVQLQAEIEQEMGITLSDAALERTATLGDLRRQLGLSDSAASLPAIAERSQEESQNETYPRWTWSRPVQALRAAFIECVQQPLICLLAAPEVYRAAKLDNIEQPLLLIANHVTAYDLPLALYALPRRMRRHVATAMAANVLEDFREGRNQGSWFLNMLGPLTHFVLFFLFNVFPLPRSAGFRKSFQHAGEALDRGYNVMIFPEGQRSDDGNLAKFRPGIGLLVAESKVPVLPIGLMGLGDMKQRRRGWFRSGQLKVRVGTPMTFAPEMSAEEITEQLWAEIARLIDSAGVT